MRLTIAAVGKLKAGAERELTERYVERAGQLGRNLGIEVIAREVSEGRADRPADRIAEEGDSLRSNVGDGAIVVALDEAGKAFGSADFSDRIAEWRDRSVPEIAFVIGGADGLSPGIKERADLVLAFGAMTWPHQLARAMLAEQIYRALTILVGHPYHRA